MRVPPVRVLLVEVPLLQVGHLHCRIEEAPPERFLLAEVLEGRTDFVVE